MDKQKIVVVLLLATIILSIASIVVTFSINTNNFNLQKNQNAGSNAGNVQLVVAEPVAEETGGEK